MLTRSILVYLFEILSVSPLVSLAQKKLKQTRLYCCEFTKGNARQSMYENCNGKYWKAVKFSKIQKFDWLEILGTQVRLILIG